MRQTAWLAMLALAGMAVSVGGVNRSQAAIQDDLVVHLRFDGDLEDSSGRNNDGAPGGSALFFNPDQPNSDGVTRQPLIGTGSLDLSYAEATEYVTFPNTLSDLLFGATTDFTVSLWAQRVTNPNTGIADPSFIGNKDWDDGGNQGWVLYDSEGHWGWNWKGADGARRDFGGKALPAGEWHNIVVTQDRDGVATFYQDGSSLGSVSIAGSGNIDTNALDPPLTTNIGQDGAGDYGPKLTHNLDDLGVWRRALNAAEVLTIAKLGRSGTSLSEIEADDVLVLGDVNGDRATNEADYLIWNANVGFTTGTGLGTDESYGKGDVDYNGVIDLGDFKIIADAAHPPLGVPEPSTMFLMVGGIACLGAIRKCRR